MYHPTKFHVNPSNRLAVLGKFILGFQTDLPTDRSKYRPVYSSSGQLFHALHAKMSDVKKIQDLGLKALRNHHPSPVDEASMTDTE